MPNCVFWSVRPHSNGNRATDVVNSAVPGSQRVDWFVHATAGRQVQVPKLVHALEHLQRLGRVNEQLAVNVALRRHSGIREFAERVSARLRSDHMTT